MSGDYAPEIALLRGHFTATFEARVHRRVMSHLYGMRLAPKKKNYIKLKLKNIRVAQAAALSIIRKDDNIYKQRLFTRKAR